MGTDKMADEITRVLISATRGDLDAAARIVRVSRYLDHMGALSADEAAVLRVMRAHAGWDLRATETAPLAALSRTRTQTALSRLVARGHLGTRDGLYWWVIPDGSVMIDCGGTVHGYSADRDLPRFGARW